jgi:diguanylate cyclase (GGDEF)-like protein
VWFAFVLISICLCNLQVSAAWGSLADPVFQAIAQDIDLQTMVLPWTLAEDSEGFLWGGGDTGLLRWDGYRARVYIAGGRAPDGLHDNYVLTLHGSPDGTMWVGTATDGLGRYDPVRDRFVPIPLGKGPQPRVGDIDDDGHGGLWVASEIGLFHLDAENRIIWSGLGPGGAASPGCLGAAKLSSVRRDRQGVVWIGSDLGLARGTAGNTCFVPVPLPGAASAAISRLMADSAGRIWIGTEEHGAYVDDLSFAIPRPIAATSAPPGQSAAAITALQEVSPGKIWIGTQGRGIVAVDGETLATTVIRRNLAVPDSLRSDSIYCIYRDHAGLVWVATSQGLSQYAVGNGSILTMFGGAGRPDRLSDESVESVAALPDGRVLAGLESNGIAIIDPAAARITPAVGLAGKSVIAMAPNPAGGTLLATLHAGLYLARGNLVQNAGGSPWPEAGPQHLTRLSIPEFPPGSRLYDMKVIGGSIWVGGVLNGVWQLRLGGEGVVQVQRHVATPELTNGTVRAIEPAPGGLIAIGTDNGLNLLDPASGHIERILPDHTDPQGLPAGRVVSFTTDHQGRLWVGSDSAGIAIMTGRDTQGRPRFHHLGLAEGLPNLDINTMLVDFTGRIWVSTDDGLAVIDPRDFGVRALGRADGVAVLSYWARSGAVVPSGYVLFGGLGGLTVVRPEALPPRHSAHAPVVTEIRVGGVMLPASEWVGTGAVTLTPDLNSLAVEFSALDYSAPDHDLYRYRLAGFDRDWTQTDSGHRVAAYTNLPPGTYSLLLQVADRSGAWTGHVTSLPIQVLPAWFETQWFRFVVFLIAALMIVCIVQARTVYLRRRQHELERQVAERTAELSASQTQLERFAYFDTLTALPNRRAFNDSLQRLVSDADRHRRPFSLLLVDLDGFKQVNDSLGHQAGDEVLSIAASRLRAEMREGDFVARLGGDEFAALLDTPGDETGTSLVCDRIVTGMAKPMRIGATQVTIGASVGAALFPMHGGTQDELYRRADLALYKAKRAGRGRWEWFKEESK